MTNDEHLLDGVRVIEIGDEVSAYAGKLLAGLGADVIKVEPPEGCSTRGIGPFYEDEPGLERSLFWWHYSIGKRSITLEPTTEEGRSALLDLLGTADSFSMPVPGLSLSSRVPMKRPFAWPAPTS